ncbi:unnamed protein product [Urochloa decumbens]|uniref:Uncharacterized protein n=1 Tax=Urochloa decumbens TaxID=240449 RepID=A0ABC8VK43_9POAL
MAPSIAAALKRAFLVAMCVMLLHYSSMGQQLAPAPAPAPTIPPSDCPRYCSSQCTHICQASSDDWARRCDSIRPELAYASCFEGCSSSQCNGNSGYARGTCTLNSCSASTCGCPCARRCCESCTGSAVGPYATCMSAQPKVYAYCMPGCTADCNNRCANGTVAYGP